MIVRASNAREPQALDGLGLRTPVKSGFHRATYIKTGLFQFIFESVSQSNTG